jgi:hypothetical protein
VPVSFRIDEAGNGTEGRDGPDEPASRGLGSEQSLGRAVFLAVFPAHVGDVQADEAVPHGKEGDKGRKEQQEHRQPSIEFSHERITPASPRTRSGQAEFRP